MSWGGLVFTLSTFIRRYLTALRFGRPDRSAVVINKIEALVLPSLQRRLVRRQEEENVFTSMVRTARGSIFDLATALWANGMPRGFEKPKKGRMVNEAASGYKP